MSESKNFKPRGNPELPQDKRKRKHPNQLRPASSLVPDVLRTVPGLDLQLAQLCGGWNQVIGPPLDRFTLPEKILFRSPQQQDNGILQLRVTGAAALEVQHLEPQIVERVNAYFGYRLITGLKIVQGVIPQPPASKRPAQAAKPLSPKNAQELEQYIESVTDEQVKEQLKKLGGWILSE